MSSGADRQGGGPWIATAAIIRNGEQTGSGVYLNSGLIITAAHLTAVDAKMGVRIGGLVLPALPAKILKQGSSEDVDLSLLLVDEEKLLTSVSLPRMQLCEAPPWPGDPVIVVDATHATESQIVPPQVLPFTLRTRFSTLIRDVATTGDSGSGVFDPSRKCLLGIISGKLTFHTTEGDKNTARSFVPALAIRGSMPVAFATVRDSSRGRWTLRRQPRRGSSPAQLCRSSLARGRLHFSDPSCRCN